MKNALIETLENAIIEAGNNREQIAVLYEMKIKEKERRLREEADWDASRKIYLTGNGYYKTKHPIQICRAKRNDVIEKMYAHFFGMKTKSLL